MENGSRFFAREIGLIENKDLQNFVKMYFDNYVGDWFFSVGASSTGRFHPNFTKGEGGLIRHTKSVVLFCEELLRLNTYAYMRNIYKDYARVACLLHDTCKYGTENLDKSCYKNHGALAADRVSKVWEEFFNEPCPDMLTMAIRSHMGQWTENKEDRPFTNLDRLVHLADYIASRSFIDIPIISDEYNEDVANEDFPF